MRHGVVILQEHRWADAAPRWRRAEALGFDHDYDAVGARAHPGCVQRPRVPFVLAGNAGRSIAFAARNGEGWITTGEPTDDVEVWWRAVAEKAKRLDDAPRSAASPTRSSTGRGASSISWRTSRSSTT